MRHCTIQIHPYPFDITSEVFSPRNYQDVITQESLETQVRGTSCHSIKILIIFTMIAITILFFIGFFI